MADGSNRLNGMDRRTLLQGAGALGFAACTLPLSARAAPGFAGASEIEAVIARKVAARQLPGAIVALGMRKAPREYAAGGTLDFDSAVKVDENTIWRLASLTKPTVGMAAVLLISQGKIRLDQPVADFIPVFANQKVMPDPNSGELRPAARQTTIRHLLTHTSGLANDTPGKIGDAYRRAGLRGGRGAPAADALAPAASLKEYAERLGTMPLVVDPGNRWLYSPNPDVMGRVIEIVSGVPFDVFLDKHLFAPLGMRSTYFWVPERDKGRLVTSYNMRDGKLVGDSASNARALSKPAFPSGSGGLLSTAHDYDRFMAMIVNMGTLNGTTVLPAEAVRLGTSNLLPPGTDMSQYTSKTGHDGFGAFGMVTTGGPRPGTYGWGGSSGTTGFCNPQMGSRWGSFTNVGASDFARLAMAAANMGFAQAAQPGGAGS